MKKCIKTIILFLLVSGAYSQGQFVKSFDSYTHPIYSMCKINSTSIALTGTTNDSAAGDWDCMLIKADIWKHFIG
jgi:hypothetical protein